MKCKNHYSIFAIQKYSKNKIFYFEEEKIGEIKKEILKLDKSKASQKADTPTIIIKENFDISPKNLCMSIKGAIKSANFPSSSKLADVKLWYKKWRKDIKENFWPLSTETSSKNVCLVKCLPFSITIFRINDVVFENDVVLNIAVW